MNICRQPYHDERGEVQDCSEDEPCRACLRVELSHVVQVSGVLCEKCGWAMRFPDEPCRCELADALEAAQARIAELTAAGAVTLPGLTDEQAEEIASQHSIETTKYAVFRIWGIAQSRLRSRPSPTEREEP